MLPSDDHLASPYGASGLNVWFPNEYEGGHRARFAGASESWTATPCWQAGWQEADRELTACSRRHPCVSCDRNTNLDPAELNLFGAGDLARKDDLPFDPTLEDTWKRSWIRRDIELGMFPGREPIDEASGLALDALPVRQPANSCARLVSHLLHAATAG